MTSPPTPPEHESESRPLIVEWYRVDQSKQVVRVLMIAAPVLLIGCLCVAFAWTATHRPAFMRGIAGVIGAVFNVGGPLYAILGLKQILMQDSYIALRTDGVTLREDHVETTLRWDDIDEVRCHGYAVEFLKRDGTTMAITQRFAGITASELAKRVEHVRKRAAFGMPVLERRR
ncbi:MAG: hypothetical protein IPK60_11340 [Sandaracinaceae bacterium]|nr:hypothetical protein [Sandaracinaceae bacterium]